MKFILNVIAFLMPFLTLYNAAYSAPGQNLTAFQVSEAQRGCVNNCFNGTGTYYYADGGRYEGQWEYGTRNGQGTYYFTNGDRYEGEWRDDTRNGQGTYYYADGSRYEGEWKENKIDGQGTFYFFNGNRHEGQWKDGKPDGQGTSYDADGGQLKGEWVDGELESVEVCVFSVCFSVAAWLYVPSEFVEFVAVFVALSLFYYGLKRWYKSKRSEALRSAALTLGMSFEDGRNINATQRFGPFQLFSLADPGVGFIGKRSKVDQEKFLAALDQGGVRYCLSGTIDGVDVTMFEYSYDVLIGEVTKSVRQTVVLFHSKELSLPEFELRPRRFRDKFTFRKGRAKDIDFDSRPGFSKSYVLSGNDESAIRHVFSRNVLEYFERHQGLSVEGKNGRLLCYRHNTTVFFSGLEVRPDKIKLFLDQGRAVLGLFRTKP